MFGAILAIFLQAAAPQVSLISDEPAVAPVAEAPAASEPTATTDAPPAEAESAAEPVAARTNAIPEGMMNCEYNRGTRIRMCTTSTGEVLRCRRERRIGTRFYSLVCFTDLEDRTIQRDTHQAIDRQQHVTTPGGG